MIAAPSDTWFNSWGGIWIVSADGRYTCSWYPNHPYNPLRKGPEVQGIGTDRKSAQRQLFFTMREYMWEQIEKF